MQNISKFLISILVGLLIFFTSCKKTGQNSKCFDSTLKEASKGTNCTMDCPGIVGCDGKIYCNECVAAWEGIRPK